MFSLGTTIRGWLSRRGYLLHRAEPEIHPSVSMYLTALRARARSPQLIVCFDNDIRVQIDVLNSFSEEEIWFACPSGLLDFARSPIGEGASPPPSKPFIAVIDIETFSLELLLREMPWLQSADAILIRARYGAFWAGEIDMTSFVERIQGVGFHLRDVLGSHQLLTLQAPSTSVVFACERGGAGTATTGFPRYRINEALAHFSAPIANRHNFQLLAGRGSFGFAAGVFNPGAIVDDGRLYLLSRADKTPWILQKTDEARFFTSTKPLLMTLGNDRRVENATEVSIEHFPDLQSNRAEDFRLFRYREMIFSNHAVVSEPASKAASYGRLQMERLQIRMGISRLNPEAPSLTWCGFPTLDRPTAKVEKNWAMFTDGERLFLLYSFEPYVLLAAKNWPDLEFETVCETSVAVPFGGDGLQLRNSINPVDYDENHWLHIVHKVYPGKKYVFWATLIDKQTLLPAKVSSRPLVCGWQCAPASIIYICSAIATENEIRLFGGLDDSSMGTWTARREDLNANWLPIPVASGI